MLVVAVSLSRKQLLRLRGCASLFRAARPLHELHRERPRAPGSGAELLGRYLRIARRPTAVTKGGVSLWLVIAALILRA